MIKATLNRKISILPKEPSVDALVRAILLLTENGYVVKKGRKIKSKKGAK